MKNIFEEFAWRGYLTPRLDAAKVHPLLNHLIVGILWWSWHLPYYYYFLDRSIFKSRHRNQHANFSSHRTIHLFPTAILFGELSLLSKSTRPVFILHNVINALSMPLIIGGFIKVWHPGGYLYTHKRRHLTAILFGVEGWLLYQYRMKQMASV